MKTGLKNFLRVCIFGLLTAAMLLGLNVFFQPIWYEWNNYYTMNAFYKEPENTLETVILGPSIALTSISPTELYTNYGISAYNLGTERQPVFASYYWLQETYRLHKDTLKTVVFDVSAVREDTTTPFYHKVFDSMELSEVKLQAIWDYTDGDLGDTINFMVPLISYHNRWSDLTVRDFKKYNVDPDQGTRGYFYLGYIYSDYKGHDKVPDKITILDKKEKPGKLDKPSVEYLKKMAAFCEEKGLNLLLIRTTTNNWNSGFHNAIQPIADELGLEFLDFNFEPLYSAYGYIHAYDTKDGNHLNYYGATKFTKWIGQYLVDNYGATDVRNKPGYEHIEEQVVEYNARVVEHSKLVSSESLADYLTIAAASDNTVMITVKDDGATALTDEDRATFQRLGFEKLAKLGHRDSYIGVMENGKVIHEDVKLSSVKSKSALNYEGTLKNGVSYKLLSAGYYHGNKSFIKVNGINQMETKRGINVLVYSHVLDEIDDTTSFDTYVSSKRERYGLHNTYLLFDEEAMQKEYDPETVEGRIVAYEERVRRLEEQTILQRKIGRNNLFGFLNYYLRDPNNTISIVVYDQAAGALTDVDRQNFLNLGLTELATIQKNDSYVGYIDGGIVVAEEKANSEKVHLTSIPGLRLKSGSSAAGKTCDVDVFGTEYTTKDTGIHFIVYNKESCTVIAKTHFNTNKSAITY